MCDEYFSCWVPLGSANDLAPQSSVTSAIHQHPRLGHSLFPVYLTQLRAGSVRTIPRQDSLRYALSIRSSATFATVPKVTFLNILATSLFLASAVVMSLLGIAHLLFTFYGPKLRPRDPDLRTRMETVSPIISRETSMWRAWIGFNASHSFGALLFGAIYGYLSLLHRAFLLQSTFLLSVGLLLLVGYVVLAKRYWFSTPFRGVVLAAVLYVFGLLATLQ